jgi:predicted acylesterase/phospholipase RssA
MTENTKEPPDYRFCDLVMKGGITSGIVYPKAITRLSHYYHFKNIGGTSAGAIAAAVTAAAEYRRRQDGSRQGFDLLDKLPEELQTRLPETGRSRLLSLFQPQETTQRLFSVLVNSLNRTGTYRRILAILSGFLFAYWPAALASAAAALAVGLFGSGWITAILLLAVLLTIAIGVWVYLDITRNTVSNGFGLCNGMSEKDAGYEALTPWLHSLIQNAAGLPDDKPLTFGMLWDAKGIPEAWKEQSKGTARSIDLQMFSTNLAHGRPYLFPFAVAKEKHTRFPDPDRLFFKPEELKPYLPDQVLAWMINPVTEEEALAGKNEKKTDSYLLAAKQRGLKEIPEPRNFPVLLAARMSLSFPFLLSAVPLWAIDNYEAPEEEIDFRRCWFSDGGISSNFPIHLFDGLLPLWPTFGINLEPKIDDRDDHPFFLPQDYSKGYGERWNLFDDKTPSAAKFGGFLSAILSTMQNWNDNTLSRMPGVRDRIVRLKLNDNEGGLNLDMEQAIIERIVARGEDAAGALISYYLTDSTDGTQAKGWNDQRFIRLCTLLKMLEARSPGILRAFNPGWAYATDFDQLITNAMRPDGNDNPDQPPPGFEEPLTQKQAEALRKAMGALEQLMETLGKPEAQSVFKAIPEPELRIRPPL